MKPIVISCALPETPVAEWAKNAQYRQRYWIEGPEEIAPGMWKGTRIEEIVFTAPTEAGLSSYLECDCGTTVSNDAQLSTACARHRQ